MMPSRSTTSSTKGSRRSFLVQFYTALVLSSLLSTVSALHIVMPGGSGPVGKLLASKLSPATKVTILSRNKYLASAPNKVTEVFGWVGEGYLRQHPNVQIRDWDGGDLLDIVGCDWMGWQDDTLAKADIIINLCGGYTEQRIMATERVVRESLKVNPNAFQIVVSPTEEDISVISPVATDVKLGRVAACEDMVTKNCRNSKCVRIEANRLDQSCDKILQAIQEWEKESQS